MCCVCVCCIHCPALLVCLCTMCACLVVCYRHLFGCVLHAQSLWCTVCACESGANAPVFNLLLHVAWCCPLALTTAALQYGPEATGFVRWVAAASPWCAAQPSVSRSTCHRTWSKCPQSSSLTQPGLGRSRLRCSNYRLTPGWGVVSNKVAYVHCGRSEQNPCRVRATPLHRYPP